MKRALKISAIIIGIIAVIAIVIFAFFPGLFTYFKVKHDYPNADLAIEEFRTVEVPQDFVEYNVKGITISVPKSYTLKDTGSGFIGENDEIAVAVLETDMLSVIEAAEISDYSYDQWEYYEYEEDDYRSYFKAVGAPYPTLYDASTELLWYIRGTLRTKDCLKLRGTDRDIFLEFAESKEESLKLEDSWKLSLDGGTAYVSKSLDNSIIDYDYTSVTIYTDDGGSKHHYIMIREENDEIVNQIISSIRLSQEE